jgi:hypothetical protein
MSDAAEGQMIQRLVECRASRQLVTDRQLVAAHVTKGRTPFLSVLRAIEDNRMVQYIRGTSGRFSVAPLPLAKDGPTTTGVHDTLLDTLLLPMYMSVHYDASF